MGSSVVSYFIGGEELSTLPFFFFCFFSLLEVPEGVMKGNIIDVELI